MRSLRRQRSFGIAPVARRLVAPRQLAVMCAAAGAALAAVAPASAERPVGGARYVDTDYAFWAELRVSKSGHSFSPRGSRVWNTSDWQCQGLDFHLGSRGRPVAIGRGGRFRFTRREGKFVLRLRGRFLTRNRAAVTFRYRREAGRRSQRRCDDSGANRLYPERVRALRIGSCRTHHAKTVLQGPTGRVFWRRAWDDQGGDGWMKVAYGCLFSVDEAFRLGQDDDDDSDLKLFRLAGPYVAFEREECSMGCGFSVHVHDLRDGTELREAPRYPGDASFGRVSDLELKDNGSVAWISGAPPYTAGAPVVWAYDSLGWRQLDGGNVSPESLTLNGSILTWVNDGVTRSAVLD